jgi:hypothetical protein
VGAKTWLVWPDVKSSWNEEQNIVSMPLNKEPQRLHDEVCASFSGLWYANEVGEYFQNTQWK